MGKFLSSPKGKSWTAGEPDEVKVSRPVRRGVVGNVTADRLFASGAEVLFGSLERCFRLLLVKDPGFRGTARQNIAHKIGRDRSSIVNALAIYPTAP